MKLVLIPFEVRKGCADADLSIDFLRFKIHYRGTIINVAKAGIFARIEENCLKQGGLPFSAMAKGSYITNVTRFNAFHLFSFP
jgi:hypothetical protein